MYIKAESRYLALLTVLFIITIIFVPQISKAATQVTQYGITWTFNKDYQTGQFANGDYWVVGPVTIINIDPKSTDISGRVKNGSMVNPSPIQPGPSPWPPGYTHGYDSALVSTNFEPTLNVGRPNNQDISSKNSLVVQPGSSLVSTISVDGAGATPQFRTAAILTVLTAPAPAGSFRPAYCDNDKTIRFNKSQLDYSLLGNLPPVSSTPRLHQQPGDTQDSSVERMFERPWIDHIPDWLSRALHPAENMPNYGREISAEVGTAALMLHLDYSNAEKETLLVRFVQLGIDNYSIVKAGGHENWPGNGGHASGRKWPILFAGLMLNDAEMKAIGTTTAFPSKCGTGPCFGEDSQTFYVTQADVDIASQVGGPCKMLGHHDSECNDQEDYTQQDISLPEWGIRHYYDPFQDDRNWHSSTKSGYRYCCTACSWAGWTLAAHIMEETAQARTLWNHKAIFDYQDRYMDIEGDWRVFSELPNGPTLSAFVAEMWDTYRANYRCIWTRDNPADIYSNGSNVCDQTGIYADAGPDKTVTDSDKDGSEEITLDGSSSSGDIISYIWTDANGVQIASGVSSTVSLDVGPHTITLTVKDDEDATDTDTLTVTVEPPDTKAPEVESVTPNKSSVHIIFNEPLDPDTAEDTSNYSITGLTIIESIWSDIGDNRVTLYTTEHQDGADYTLTLRHLTDTAGNEMPETQIQYTYTQGLVGYWKFDDGSGSTAVDSSDSGSTAYLINDPVWTAQGELNFDGNNDAVQISTANMETNSGAIALWANPTNLSGLKYLFGHCVGSWTNSIQLYTNEGRLCLGLSGNHEIATNIYTLTTATWYHIALTWDATSYAVYVDGILRASGTYPPITTLNGFADIGNDGNISFRDEAFAGLIDEVRLYNKPLDIDEITDLALEFLPIGDKTVAEGSQLSFAIRIKSGTTLELSYHNLPSTPSLVANVFTWTPGYDDAGMYEAEFTAEHGDSPDFEKITISVTDVELPDINDIVPIGHWAFDETSGETASDSSPSNNTGQLRNGLVWASGKIGGALAFSIPNDAVEIQTTNFDTTSGTIAMWVYCEKLTLARHYLFGHATEPLANRIQLYLKYGNLCVGLGDSHATSENIFQLQTQRWYHVTLVWSGTTYRVYVDGLLRALGTHSGLTEFGNYAEIGNNGINRNKAIYGKLDDVRVYNLALSAVEIAQLAVD